MAATCAALLIALAVIFGSPSAFNGITPTPARPATQPLQGPAAPAASRPVPGPALAAARTAPTPSSAVPAPVTLHRGDTLWGLAHHYHTTVATLQTLNALGHSTLIYAGRTLLVPAASVPVASVPAALRPPHAPAPAAVNPTHAHGPSGAAAAIAFAEHQLGVPYLWGGTGAGGYDCSGLIQAAWHAAGVELPRTTYEQVNAGTHLTRAQLQPGDLVFSNNDGHVQLYIGHGTVIEAPHTGATVQYSPLPPPAQTDAYVRVA